MIRRHQLYKHDPDNGLFGDCHRTALACILDLEPEQVPNFGVFYDEPELFHKHVVDWLKFRNLRIIEIRLAQPLDDVLAVMANWAPDIYYILGGVSEGTTGHSVVGLNDEIIWDPDKGKVGINAPFRLEGLEFYVVNFLVPIQTWSKHV